MELYWASGSLNSWRIMLAMLFKDLDYEDTMLSIQDRDHVQLGYTSLNPRSKVPTLVHGELVVTESIAILAYLDRAFPSPALLGARPADGGRIWRKVMEVETFLLPSFNPVVRALAMGNFKADVRNLREKTGEMLAELDRHEAAAERDNFNAVDCVLVPIIASLQRVALTAGAEHIGLMPVDWSRWPQLMARYEAVRALEGFDRTWPPSWA